MSSRTKAHIQYQLSNGEYVPGVTAAISVLNKPALLQWAYNCGRRGENYIAIRDAAGGIGTLVHYLIMCKLSNIEPDTSDYSQSEITTASVCLMKYFAWEEGKRIIPVLIEQPLVSEKYHYGGTIDFYGIIDITRTLLDLKTGKNIYEEHLIQVAAYEQLLIEHDYPLDEVHILRTGRTPDEGFDDKRVYATDKYFQIFLNCLSIYTIRQGLR